MMSNDPEIVAAAATSLRIIGFAQLPFAAMMIFGGALRGAGDTAAVMMRNLGSAIAVRMLGALIVVKGLGLGLAAVWCVLGIDLCVRGALLASRFYRGRWEHAEV